MGQSCGFSVPFLKESTKVLARWALIKMLWEGSASKLIPVAGRIQFLVVVELRSPLSYWLLVRGYL